MNLGLLPERALLSQAGRQHGTRTSYKRGCRCVFCMTINAAWQRRYSTIRTRPRHQRLEQLVAHRAVRAAIDRGELTIPTACSSCGSEPRPGADGSRTLDAHHESYARPLDVTWLCRACHRRMHVNGAAQLERAAA